MSLQAEIKKRFSGFTLEASLHTEEGVLGILGASGSGKSMTLKCIAGIETPDEGRIVLNGRVLFDSKNRINLPPQKRKVGYLFQNYALFPNMTVEENVAAGLRCDKAKKQQIVAEMVKLFRLDGLEKRYPSQLSGGQQQRVALARILAYEPDVIMLDEPFSALDFYLKEQLQFQVKEVLKHYHGNTLLVTHSRDEVYRFCENSIILDHGHVAASGSTREIFKNPRNVTAARITGCKNILRASRLEEYRVYLPDFGVSLRTAEPVGEDVRYVGVRAHDFYLAEEDLAEGQEVSGSQAGSGQSAPGGKEENRIRCAIVDSLRQPFEWDVVLERPEGAANETPIRPEGAAKDMSADAVSADAASDEEPGRIWWKLNMDRYALVEKRQIGDTVCLGVRPEDILLLSE